MRTLNYTFTFHLYPADLRLTNPGYDENGDEDTEFNGNYRDSARRAAAYALLQSVPNLVYDPEEEVHTPQEVTVAYKTRDSKYILRIVTDINAWPQKDPEICKQRKAQADRNELGQKWWIHHLSFPDGTTLDCDTITCPEEEAIASYVKAHLCD